MLIVGTLIALNCHTKYFKSQNIAYFYDRLSSPITGHCQLLDSTCLPIGTIYISIGRSLFKCCNFQVWPFISLWQPFGRSEHFLSASFSSYKLPSLGQKMFKVQSCLTIIQGSHFSATTKFQDFSRNLMPFSRYIFALAANLQLQF